MPETCATKIAATERYSELPVRLKLYPVGMTKATIWRGTPMASIASMARGRAASELAVPKAIVTGSATAFRNVRSGTRKISAIGSSTPRMKTISAAYSVSSSFSRLPRTRESGVSHSVGYGRSHSERRHVHHDVGELEHRLAQALAERQHGTALLLRSIMASATAKIRLKTTTCSTAPSATDLAMFSGKTCRIVSSALSLPTEEVSRCRRSGS